jgi:hypothetical protein
MGAVTWLGARRQWRSAALLSASIAAVLLVNGAVELVTLGRWFHTTRVYLRANLINGYSNIFGRQPPSYYLRVIVSSCGAAGVALLVLAAIGAYRARGLAFIVLLYLVAHSLTTLKQLRFSLIVLPLVGALAAVGLHELWRWRRAAGVTACVIATGSAIAAVLMLPRLTFGQLGANYLTNEPVRDYKGGLNRALLEARNRPDLCGLRVWSDRTLSGGITWLHRRLPVYGADDAPPPWHHFYNYVIDVNRDGSANVRSLGFSRCEPDPKYRWRAN